MKQRKKHHSDVLASSLIGGNDVVALSEYGRSMRYRKRKENDKWILERRSRKNVWIIVELFDYEPLLSIREDFKLIISRKDNGSQTTITETDKHGNTTISEDTKGNSGRDNHDASTQRTLWDC